MNFERIDDFSHYVRPDDPSITGRTFQHLVDRHFDYTEDENGILKRGENNLILSFLEIVTLVENDVIGETLLRALFRKEKVKLFIEEYKKIVDEVKKKNSDIGSISMYREWYTMGTFILMVSNPEAEQPVYSTRSSWDGQPYETVRDLNLKRKLYASNHGSITEEQVKTYLSAYYKEIENRLHFNNYPNVCVIVKPISVSNGEDFIPIGNLYLHFATRTPKTKLFYLRLLNDFMRAWYVENGYDIITEISEFAIAENFNKHQAANYYPFFYGRKWQKLDEKIGVDGATIRSYYDELYSNPKIKQRFESELRERMKRIIDLFVVIDQLMKTNGSLTGEFLELRSLISKSGLSSLKKEYSLEKFCEVLMYREAYKIGTLLFNYDPTELYIRLNELSTSNDELNYTVGSDTLYGALWTDRFIPCTKSTVNSKNKIIQAIQKCLSVVERSYLKEYEVMKVNAELVFSSHDNDEEKIQSS